MALESSGFRLRAPFGELFLWVPESFILGLRATHKGIEAQPEGCSAVRCAIRVDSTDRGYRITRAQTGFDQVYYDYVDCLNELLLQIVYEFMALLSQWELLHCSAAKTQKGEYLVAFGNKRAGKSVWAFQQTLLGGTLLADDLLAWDPVKSRFLCFGIASRLRRPVDHSAFEKLPKEAFLPGERLTYVKQTHLNLAPCGEIFLPDGVVQIESGTHRSHPIPTLKALERIRQSCIPRALYA